MFTRPSRSIAAWLALLGGVAAIVIAAVAIYGYRSERFHFVTAIDVFQWASYVAVVGLLLALIGLWRTRPGARRRGFAVALLGAVLSLPLVLSYAQFEYAARVYPPINDITTDPDNPPAFWDVANPAAYPGAATARLQREGYPDLQPLELDMAPAEAFELALQIARQKGWEIVAENEFDKQIEAVDTTLLFGFKDNIAVRITESGEGARVDVRSHSRLGKIDRGVNAKRIRDYLQTLEQQAQADR
ncbi:DUF1499 domain-containing protein [Thiohalophilus thiocyanatoxydans]|uniref:Uncharacterized protein DUF1109 n=1 Tax=Thiohalophilus thiocyanatoxydans TaxID=381308 RepID=A0A4R8IQH5_9GAMM|nr:DUF1499 domain-containing protein [Thiohalophilus thiocyanatoxydans]TDY02828.1 uncharacterized protein DUF1109 [Thiohalophilus thiocyanatoxydans]